MRSTKKVEFSDDVMEKLIAEYEAGELISVLAKRYGHAPGTIRKNLKACGVEVRNKHETYRFRVEKGIQEPKPEPEEEHIRDLGKLKALREAGWSIGNIALEFHSDGVEVKKCLEVLKMN